MGDSIYTMCLENKYFVQLIKLQAYQLQTQYQNYKYDISSFFHPLEKVIQNFFVIIYWSFFLSKINILIRKKNQDSYYKRLNNESWIYKNVNKQTYICE